MSDEKEVVVWSPLTNLLEEEGIMKMKYTLCITLASLAVSTAFSAVPSVPKVKPIKQSNVVTGGGSDVSSETVVIGAQEEACKTKDTISLELFKKVIVQDGASVTVKKNWNYCPNASAKCGVNFTLTIPAHIQNCISLQAIPRVDGNSVFMEFKNAYSFTTDNVQIPEGKTLDQMTVAEKYEGCLRKTGVLVDDKWDMTKATTGVTMLTVPKRLEGALGANDTDFDKAIKNGSALSYENKPDSKILGLSSIDFARDYPLPSSEVAGVDNPSISGCYQAHNIANGNLTISKDLELRTRAEAACTSKVYEDGVKVENDIGNSFSSLSDETKDVVAKLRATLREERAKKGKEYLDEMAQIAGELIKSKDEEEVRSYAADYVTSLNKYKAEIVDPLAAELEQLYDMRSQVKANDPKRQRELDEQIRQLNDLIGRYSSPVYKTSQVADKFLEFGVSLDAAYVYEQAQRARLYKEVRYVGSPKRKPAQVPVELKKLKDTYEKRIEFAEKVYAARTGAASYSSQYQETANRYRTQQQAAFSSFQQEEQQYAKYCQMQIWGTVQNPSRCKYGMQTQQQRYQTMMKKYSAYNSQASQQEQFYNMFNQLEVAARQRTLAENGGYADGYDPYGGEALYNFGFLNNYMGASGMNPGMQQGFQMTNTRY